VTIAAQDVDGDGRVEIALGAGWNPRNTASGGEHVSRDRSDAWRQQALDTGGARRRADAASHPLGDASTARRA
jgi:hypothetical protein